MCHTSCCIIWSYLSSDPGCKYIYLTEPRAPVITAAVQALDQAKADLETSLVRNPLQVKMCEAQAKMCEAQAKDESLKLCFRKVVKARNPSKMGDFMKSNLLYHLYEKKGRNRA